MSRISRKEMKRDEVVETVGSVVEYSRHHGQMLLWAAVGVIAAGLVVAGIFWWRQQQSTGAAAALAAAMAVEDDEAAARAGLEEVIERYPGSGAAAAARLKLAALAAAAGDGERARELWQAAAEGAGDSVVGLQAQLNLWELGREQGRHDELIDEIRALLERDQAALSKDRLLYELGRTLEERGSVAEARDTYLRLVDEHPASLLRGAAQERADRLAGATAELG